jgi:hypothetical protein
MASPLSRRMLLADSRWDSSRSLLDSPPKAPATEDEAIRSSTGRGLNESSEDISPEVVPVSLQSEQTVMDGQDVLSALALKTSEEAKLLSTASPQGIPIELPMVCSREVEASMAPRLPRMRLSEKAASMRCLLQTPGTSNVSNRRLPSRELSRSISVTDLNLLRRMTLDDSRWASSRSLLHSLPIASVAEFEALHRSFVSGMNESSEFSTPEVVLVSLRSPQTMYTVHYGKL